MFWVFLFGDEFVIKLFYWFESLFETQNHHSHSFLQNHTLQLCRNRTPQKKKIDEDDGWDKWASLAHIKLNAIQVVKVTIPTATPT